VPKCKSTYGNMYSFLEYRVYEIDPDGKRMQVEVISTEEENLVYQIPMLMEGTELSIVPVGQYTDRTITLHDYTVNEKDEEVEEPGTWTINNMECRGTEYTFSSLVTYQVSYKYDLSKYYYVNSVPECYYSGIDAEGRGEVIFYDEKDFLHANENFSVKLHKYLCVEIENSKDGGIVSVAVGNKDVDIWKDAKKKEQKGKIILNKLKGGDVITVVTKEEFKLVPSMFELEKKPEKQTNGYEYTFTVPEEVEGSYDFSVQKWEIKDVKLEIGKMDKAVEDALKETFKKGESLLTISTGNKEYTYEECTKEKSLPLKESEDLTIIVSRKMPDDVKVHIVVNNDDKNVIKINKNSTSAEYEIKWSYDEVKSLRISVLNEGLDAENTSNLAVTLDKKLGTNTFFTIKQVLGETMVAEKGYGTSGSKLYEGKVDADKDIVILGQMQLDVNSAIKLEITKAVGGTEIRYCTGKIFEEIITTKEGEEYCGDIKVDISLVDKVEYKPMKLENGTIELRFADTDGHVLKVNELLEENRKVVVTVTAKNGYYIEGSLGYKSNISSDSTTYEAEMKFSDYEKDIEKIVTKNPIKKLVMLTLNVSAPKSVGKVTYCLNGDDSKIVSETGTYSFKEGDEVEITWDVSDTDYKLVNEWFTVPGVNWTANNKMEKKIVKLTITADMVGTTIYAENIEAFAKLELKKEDD